ncbi:hypothetical protein ACQR53_16895 [Xanthomonas oryzae]|uniref:Uncharacterized protein n=1 Tax=Xanthomonas oryzae pv. leersiae TaxID=3112258 RepID=A0AAJ6KL87_9XANT|nr:hypothetical protein [Xanthomonas oryzae]QBG94853.1 hypothetical protein EYC55_04250 [Xanthomonas oryzae]QBH02704.1 hypothetical protein EYC57_03670 [Xanthomonas oryzae]UNE62231.1 hypothetical protein MML47_18680 [Xanthomonas oryzae]WIX06163.1 hypothetical protein QN060_18980 [Xanthomonas oryzae pv. oryzae]
MRAVLESRAQPGARSVIKIELALASRPALKARTTRLPPFLRERKKGDAVADKGQVAIAARPDASINTSIDQYQRRQSLAGTSDKAV